MEVPHRKLSTTFVGQKVSAVKWIGGQQMGEKRLLTASWDDKVNHLTLWSVPYSSHAFEDDADEVEPKKLCTLPMRASITSLANGSSDDEVIVATADGRVLIVDILQSNTMEIRHSWDNLHTPGCACTSVESRSPDFKIATAGEDGRLHILNLDQHTPVRMWGDGFGATINDLAFRSQSEIFSVNSVAQLQIWDVRVAAAVNTFRFENTSKDDGLQELHSVSVHAQGNKVATGDNSGVLQVWDIRMANQHVEYPESLVQAHTRQAEIWQIQFHPTHRDHMFTASEDGKLLWWNTNPQNDQLQDFYLPGESDKLEVRDLINEPHGLGVNSLDVEEQLVACGTDGETFCVFAPNFN